MLLQQITLQNIRSYVDQTMVFPEGSILLSGDIGSGKSTILLAIEFALFGPSRPDLPAEALLRKGAASGFVELSFMLQGNRISIKRSLKKEKNGIKQLPGHLIINNIKKELMPVELKAEVISLLGYPEDLLTKNKNYLFRYTVYTPQEEMKLILQENPETRLDTLRRIFNIDKYKIIRENMQVYLRKMRSEILSLQVKIEPLEELKRKLLEIQREKEKYSLDSQEKEKRRQEAAIELSRYKEEAKLLEQKLKEYQNNFQALTIKTALLHEKGEQLKHFLEQQESCRQKLLQIDVSEGKTKEMIEQNITRLEKEKISFQARSSLLQQQVNQYQEHIKELEVEISNIKHSLQEKSQKEQQRGIILKELEQKEELMLNVKNTDHKLQEILQHIASHKAKLENSSQKISQILSLDNCPACFQVVKPEHKEQIKAKEGTIVQEETKKLKTHQVVQEQLQAQKTALVKRLEQLQAKESFLFRLESEIFQLQQKEILLQELQEKFENYIHKNDQAIQEITSLQQEKNIGSLQQELEQERKTLSKLEEKKHLDTQYKNILSAISVIEEQQQQLRQQIQELQYSLQQQEDPTLLLEEKRLECEKAVQKEREILVILAEIKAKLENWLQKENELHREIELLTTLEHKLIRHQELYHWLEEQFLNLTYTIEKHLLVTIHHEFNSFFQEWLSTLLDDETITSRIDESFTPIIEQNGYDISFENLSGGEKTSASLAYRLALNKVINDIIHEIKTKEVLILDEPTDGFSAEQLDKVRDVLDRLNLRQMIIVSHESKIESFVENVIRINKEGQESSIT